MRTYGLFSWSTTIQDKISAAPPCYLCLSNQLRLFGPTSPFGARPALAPCRTESNSTVCVSPRFPEPRHAPSIGLWYPKGANLELVGYSDADFVGCLVDRKSTSGGCHLLGHSLVSWSSKKQNSVSLSTTEAEYIAAASCCAPTLYMKQTLLDCSSSFSRVPLLCDNKSAIKLTKNPVLHQRIKHIDIRHHFLRDHEAKGDISMQVVGTKEQLADIFTKPSDESFC
jgi:hypothetical protein